MIADKDVINAFEEPEGFNKNIKFQTLLLNPVASTAMGKV